MSTGCWTCRIRKKRCEGPGPSGNCPKCVELQIECLRGYGSPMPSALRSRAVNDAIRDWNVYRYNHGDQVLPLRHLAEEIPPSSQFLPPGGYHVPGSEVPPTLNAFAPNSTTSPSMPPPVVPPNTGPALLQTPGQVMSGAPVQEFIIGPVYGNEPSSSSINNAQAYVYPDWENGLPANANFPSQWTGYNLPPPAAVPGANSNAVTFLTSNSEGEYFDHSTYDNIEDHEVPAVISAPEGHELDKPE